MSDFDKYDGQNCRCGNDPACYNCGSGQAYEDQLQQEEAAKRCKAGLWVCHDCKREITGPHWSDSFGRHRCNPCSVGDDVAWWKDNSVEHAEFCSGWYEIGMDGVVTGVARCDGECKQRLSRQELSDKMDRQIREHSEDYEALADCRPAATYSDIQGESSSSATYTPKPIESDWNIAERLPDEE